MCELEKIRKVLTSKFVRTGPSSYKKRIYRAAVSQRLRNTVLQAVSTPGHQWKYYSDTFGNRTRDLPASGAVPQPTAPSA